MTETRRSDLGQRHTPNGNYTRKLSPGDVLAIRGLYVDGWALTRIAGHYGVTYQAIAYHVRVRDPVDWLKTVPGYRDLIRRRVSEAARKAETLSRRLDRQYVAVDYLGREVEGCG